MKLLFFTSDYHIGLSSLLSDQVISLHESGIDVIAVSGEREQEVGLKLRIEQANLRLCQINGLDTHQHFKKLANELAKIIEKENINVVHVQNNWQLALISYVKWKFLKRKRLKTIYTLHGFRHNHLIKSIIARLLIGTALWLFTDHIICMSRYLQKTFWPLKYKIHLLSLGVSNHFFNYPLLPPLPENGLKIIFPAQFRKGKNQQNVLRTFANFIQTSGHTMSHLILPGSGPLLDAAKQLAYKLNINDNVSFPGQCTKEEILKLYLKSNIAVIDSNSETFGQSIVEPFVLGRCVISKAVGIAPDLIRHGENGFIFNNNDELLSIFMDLYHKKYYIKKITQQAFSERLLFQWKEISKKYDTLFLNN